MTTHPEDTFEHRARFTLPADQGRCFRALIDQQELRRWLADGTRVEARIGGEYHIAGRGAFGRPKADASGQVITELEPSRVLAFRWPIDGVGTLVRYELTLGEKPETTELAITHGISGQLPYRNPRHVIDDLWRLQVGNLVEYLSGGAGVVLPDFSDPSPEVRSTIEIEAPPAKVFRALVEPELMNRWLGGNAQVNLDAREYSYGWSYAHEGRTVVGGPTRILELAENEKLVTDWGDWRGDPGKPLTRITWLLEALPPNGSRTRLTVIHSGFEYAVDRSDYQQGWGGFLLELAKVAMGGP